MALQPLPDRIGHIGGIESLVVDGRRWYFGFDYKSDLVVSPLTDDAAAMAAFAAEHMLQTDGPHDPEYWLELLETSVEFPDLADAASCILDLADIARQGMLPYHLHYVLAAASGWESFLFDEESIAAALDTIGIAVDDRGWDCVEAVGAALDGPPPVREAAQYFLRRYTDFLLDNAPANWPEVFSALR